MSSNPTPLEVWEWIVGYRLGPSSVERFRDSAGFSELDRVPGARLILSAVLAKAENNDGHLLIAEWCRTARTFAEAGGIESESLLWDCLRKRTFSEAMATALSTELVAGLRRELNEAFAQARADVARKEAAAAELQRLREARAAEEAAAQKKRLEREEEARLAVEEARRSAKAAFVASPEGQALEREQLKEEEERRRRIEEGTRRAREDRKKPPVHDIPYRPQPWEEY